MWQIAGVIGREAELRQVRDLLEEAASGQAGVLVVKGEAGVGKSTLLDAAAEAAGPLRQVRVVGVPAERDVPHAGLHALLGPLLTHEVLTGLPPLQRAALRTALGLEVGPTSGRLVLGAAVLSVLATSGPLCLLVDDLQWLDPSSADALLFAARRLRAEPVALLATVRSPATGDEVGHDAGPEPDTTGLQTLWLGGLPDRATAEALLPSVHARVVDLLLEATGGNPLAMIEVASELTVDEAEGVVPLPAQLPTSQPEQVFGRRLATLAPRHRLAARVAALAGSAPRDVVQDALTRGGMSLGDLDGVVALGLCRVDAAVSWRHPLARAAAARGRTPERRQVHGWLAEAHRTRSGAASAWHLAESVDGHDQEASLALQAAARSADERGASADAADAWQRAASLDPAPAECARLVEKAAGAALRAGATRRAADLIDTALQLQPGPEAAARLLWRRGRVQHTLGSPRRALELFLQAADLGQDRDLRVWATAEAMYAAMYAGALDQVERTAALVRLHADLDDPVHAFLAAHATGAAHALHHRPLDAHRAMDDARRLLSSDLLERHPALTLWAVNLELFDPINPRLDRRLLDALDRMRASGDLTWLPRVTHLAASRESDAHRWPQALALMEECELLSRMSGQHTQLAESMLQLAEVDALRGDRLAAESRLRQAHEILRDADVPWLSAVAGWVGGLAALSLGDWDRAATLLTGVLPLDPGGAAPAVDAVLRSGGRGRVQELLVDGEAWSDQVRLRVAALLDEDPLTGAQRLLELVASSPPGLVQAFERVAIGERLRRAGRRQQAREQLRLALGFFQGVSAEPWVRRLEEELRASGATLRHREEGQALTPSELRTATMAAEGLTNKAIAETLVLSAKTVEFHLGNAYRKLGVANRTALARALADHLEASGRSGRTS